MIASRSPWGRTSFLWAAGFVVLGLTSLASGQMARRRFDADPAALDAYYVAARFHWFGGVGVLFLLFAIAYFALERLNRGRRRRLLGGLHFAASFLGANLVFLPQHLLGLAPGLFPGLGGVEGFFLFNGVSSAGYVTALAGQVFFVAVLIDALRHEPDLR